MLYAMDEWHDCPNPLNEALQPLFDYALDSGIADEIGADAMFELVHKTFNETIDDYYNGEDDFAKSIDWAYEQIRKRKAEGGPGWEPS